MKQALNSLRVGLFFLLGLALIYITWSTLSDRRLRQEKGYPVQAVFQDVKTLAPRSDVRLAGVRIGAVDSMHLEGGQAVLTLKIEEQYRIPRDSTASIGIASLLGQNYILIEYGSADAPPLAAGERIPTRESPDFNDIVRQVGELSNKLNTIADGFGTAFGAGSTAGGGTGPAAPAVGPANLFQNLNALVVDNREKIDRVLTNLDQLTSKLNQGEGTLGKLLTSDEVYRSLLATTEEIQRAARTAEETLGEAQTILADVKAGQGALGQLVYNTEIVDQLKGILGNFSEFSTKLNSGQGTLGQLVNDDALYRDLRALLQQAQEALGSMSDAGPISAVGASASALF